MSFLKLMHFLEERLGHHHVPVNARAQNLPELFATCAVHDEFVKETASAIFKHNACRRPQDNVLAEPTLAALAPIRLKILQSPRTDVDLFHFVESLCAAADAYFRESDEALATTRQPRRAQSPAPVVPFKRGLRAKSREKSLA